MKLYAISDDKDALTGLRLAGVEGCLLKDKKDIEVCIEQVRANPEIAVLLITENCAAAVPETVKELKLSSENPLLVVIPDSHGSSREPDSITKLIREAIGIKV